MADEDLDRQARLARALFDDPDTRPLIEEAIVKKFPKALIPGREARVASQQALSEMQKERAEWKAEMEREKQARLLESERQKVKETYGVSDAEIPEIEKIMQERLIGNHQDATEKYLASKNRDQVAAPRSIFQTMDVPGLRGNHGDEFKGVNGGPSIIADRDTWARQMAEQIGRDFAQNPASAAKRWG